MGDLRNIKRTYCFGRALGKFNKKSPLNLNPSGVYLLYALHDLNTPATVHQLQANLKKCKHYYSTTSIKQGLTAFAGEGWLKAEGVLPVRYALTMDGKNILKEVERRIRNERSDK